MCENSLGLSRLLYISHWETRCLPLCVIAFGYGNIIMPIYKVQLSQSGTLATSAITAMVVTSVLGIQFTDSYSSVVN